jgi:lipopolysaccharide cholinephosphotransferase
MINETLNKLHIVEKEILDEVVRICNKYDIAYFFIGGTLLGAVRHKGFIPWDDDIDIGMLRSDYEKFIVVCKNELSKSFFILDSKSCPAYVWNFTKICKNNTIVNEDNIESNVDNYHKGIFIDLFIYDNVTNNRIFNNIQNHLATKINSLLRLKVGLKKEKRKNIIFNFLALFISIKQINYLNQKVLTLIKFSNYIFNWGGTYGINEAVFNKESFFPLTDVVFEGNIYKAPGKYNVYLKTMYGDNYMELPPIEKRNSHNLIDVIFDTNNYWRRSNKCLKIQA